MSESSIRIDDRRCKCKDPGGLVCFQCDDYAKAVEFAKSRNQVDADGNVRIGIADFQPRFNIAGNINHSKQNEDEVDEDVAEFMMKVFDSKERGDYVEMIARNSVQQRLNGEFVVMDQKEIIDEAHRIDRQWDRLHGKNSRHG